MKMTGVLFSFFLSFFFVCLFCLSVYLFVFVVIVVVVYTYFPLY